MVTKALYQGQKKKFMKIWANSYSRRIGLKVLGQQLVETQKRFAFAYINW